MAVAIAVWQFISERRRNRRQLTLEAYERLQVDAFKIFDIWLPSEISDITDEPISVEYKELSAALARIELFCIGIRKGIYDYKTFYAVAHGYFDKGGTLYYRMLPILEKKLYNAKEDYYENIHWVWGRTEKNKKKVMTISEFKRQLPKDISENTIKKIIVTIPGAVFEHGEWSIPEGSRYPYNVRHTKFDNIDKRRYTLLRATYQLEYIDNERLRMSLTDFNAMLEELVDVGYIQHNGSRNTYGANAYITTIKYSEISCLSAWKQIKRIANEMACVIGNAIGTGLAAYQQTMISN